MNVPRWGGLVMLGWIAMVAGGCGPKTQFTQIRQFDNRPRPPSTVAVFTTRPPESVAVEVGIITTRAGNFEDALALAHGEAARQGCDGVLVVGEAIEASRGWGRGTSHLRAVCLIRTRAPAHAPAPPRPPPPVVLQAPPSPAGAPPAPPVVANCAPRCRSGFDCLGGQCVSSCNPPCPAGRVCMGHDETAQCVVEASPEGVPSSP